MKKIGIDGGKGLILTLPFKNRGEQLVRLRGAVR